MKPDCLEYVNNQCDVVNTPRLYGIKRINGQICGLISHNDLELFWFPKYQLSKLHEVWIDAWINLGGEVL
jgi:hypothetical protein